MTDSMLPPILLVGGGKMGAAMLAGWREQGLAPSVLVDPSPEAASLAGPDVTVVASADAIPAGFAPAAIVVAVKPQVANDVLPAYARLAADAVVLSIMAGRTVASIAALLGPCAIVRAMPNTPAAVRQGITVAFAAPGVSPARQSLSDSLLRAIGTSAWVEEEGMLDAVTAISGGGPAYVFLLAELLEQAGLDQGLPPDLARLMARQTVCGSASLLAASPQDAADLRRAVTSPKGTTERALGVLMQDGAWPDSVRRAIQAATDRSRELAGG